LGGVMGVFFSCLFLGQVLAVVFIFVGDVGVVGVFAGFGFAVLANFVYSFSFLHILPLKKTQIIFLHSFIH